jgi:hypothetical protein
MRNAALTLMALSLLSACSDTIERGVPGSNVAPYTAATNNGMTNANGTNGSAANTGLPFFTTDPSYFTNPPVYYDGGGMMVYLTSTPDYAGDFGYFVGSRHGVSSGSYCPPRAGGGYARAGGFSHHR